jgi:molecular chaperone GrpE
MAEEMENRAKNTSETGDQSAEPVDNEVFEGEIVEEGGESAGERDTVSTEVYDELVQELQLAQQQARDYSEGWQRERADFANYKRRIERDQQMLQTNIKGEVIKKYLGVLDDLERALKARPTDGTVAAWGNGIELIYRKLQNILESEGAKRIPAETELFDPSRHEAISHEESPDHESGQIIEVVQQGYTLGDRVLRPAMVRVAR